MKKLLAIFTMATLCGAMPAADSFAACDPGYAALDPLVAPTGYTHSPLNTGDGTWTVTAPYGTLSGIATCNTTSGSMGTAYPEYNFEQEATGTRCWCRMLSPARSAWVFHLDVRTSASDCAASCASRCGNYVRSYAQYRGAMFESLTEDVCVANTINVNWQNASGTTGSSSSCTYDGTLATPAAAPEKRGYTFTGWVAQ